MIISGFPGIGKSTLANSSKEHVFIDLESSCFGPPNERDPLWQKSYIRIADYLSKQGFHVFVSSHADVQASLYMLDTDQKKVVIYPDISLRDSWIERLRQRYEASGLEKDKRALETAEKIYDPAVRSMSMSAIPNHIILKSMDYDLEKEISAFSI